MIPIAFERRSGHRARTAGTAAFAAVLAFLVIGSAEASRSKPKPLPTPSFTLSVVPSGNHISIKGGFRFKGKPLKTTYRWTEQELDASGAPLTLVTPGSATGIQGANVSVRVPGANRAKLTVTATTPATKTHKAGSTLKPRTFTVPLGGYAAVGSAWRPVGTFGGSDYCSWSKVILVDDGSPTAQLPNPIICPAALGRCQLVSTGPQPPTDIIPAADRGNGVSDGTVTSTGLTVYGSKVVCGTGSWAEAQMWVRFGYPNGDACELPLAGVSSFTIPPDWGGNISFWADLVTFDSKGGLVEYVQLSNQPPFQGRTSGTIDVCQAYHLPPLNGSSVISQHHD